MNCQFTTEEELETVRVGEVVTLIDDCFGVPAVFQRLPQKDSDDLGWATPGVAGVITSGDLMMFVALQGVFTPVFHLVVEDAERG